MFIKFYFGELTLKLYLDGVPITYSMYGGDNYDFDDDIDELFNLASFLIETNPLAEVSEVRSIIYYGYIVRISIAFLIYIYIYI